MAEPVQIRRLKQETARKKKKIRDKQEESRKDNAKQIKFYSNPNTEILDTRK
jgi:hypothetical protein